MKNASNRRATKSFALSAARFLPAALVLALALPAHAVTPGDIVLGDITVMRLRTPSGGVTAEQRASLVQDRVNQILAIPNLTDKDVTVVKTKYGPTIYVKKIKLITVDADTAKDQGVTPDALAKTWAHRLMGVIAQVDIRLPGGPPVKPGSTLGTTPAGAPATPPAPTAAPATPPAAATGTPAAPATNPATPPSAPSAATPVTPTPTAPDTTTPAAPPAAANPANPTTPAAPAAPPAAPPTAPAPATPPPAAAPDVPRTPTNPAPAPAPAPGSPATPDETSKGSGTS